MVVLHYGVLSEITPAVCASAYATAGIAIATAFFNRFQGFDAFVWSLRDYCWLPQVAVAICFP